MIFPDLDAEGLHCLRRTHDVSGLKNTQYSGLSMGECTEKKSPVGNGFVAGRGYLTVNSHRDFS